MLFGLDFLKNHLARKAQRGRASHGQWLITAAVCATVIAVGTLVVNQHLREIEAHQKIEVIRQESAIHASLNRELNSVLYLTSGLSSYLTVRHGDLQKNEVESILATLHRDSRHIRVLAVAVGYRITYIYPIKGNEKVIGLSYADLPDQWPDVKRIIDGERPVLLGPINLVQGGKGLIYRVPIFIKERYWGLLSLVIDSESLLGSALDEMSKSRFAIALRGQNSTGMRGAVFWGKAELFNRDDVRLFDIDVPGGKWVAALHSTASSPQRHTVWLLHGLVWLLGLTLGWSTWIILTNRAKLAHLALFDPLTDLPNRLLIDDRINQAISALRRDPSRTCLLLFADLERFKQINDQFGHRAGDFTLQCTAQRISNAVREIDTVGRWGGDEFIVFMDNIERSKIPELSKKIRQAVEQPTMYAGQQLNVGVSIGYAVTPDDGTTLDKLLLVADQRMYADKTTRNAAR